MGGIRHLGFFLLVTFLLSCSEDNTNFTPVDINDVGLTKGTVTLTVDYKNGYPALSWQLPPANYKYNKVVVFRSPAKPASEVEALPASQKPAAAGQTKAKPAYFLKKVQGKGKLFIQNYQEGELNFEEIARISGTAKQYIDAKAAAETVYIYRIMAVRGTAFLVSKVDNGSSTDKDGDSVNNHRDGFPDDPYEWDDADGDGVGDNADLDDDGDGLFDYIETQEGLDPNSQDSDNDGISDLNDFAPVDGQVRVSTVIPNRGFDNGGTLVVIGGTNLPKDVRVFFGEKTATVLSVSGEAIQVRTPAHEPTSVDIVLKYGKNETYTKSTAFTYYNPAALTKTWFVKNGAVDPAPLFAIGQTGIVACLEVNNLSSGPLRVWDEGAITRAVPDSLILSFLGDGVDRSREYTISLLSAEAAKACLTKDLTERYEEIGLNEGQILPGVPMIYAFAVNIGAEASKEKIVEKGSTIVQVGALVRISNLDNRAFLSAVQQRGSFTLTEVSELSFKVNLIAVKEIEGRYIPAATQSGSGLTVVENQPFGFQIVVENKGFAPFSNLGYRDVIVGGTGDTSKIELISPPDQESVDIPGKGTHTFTFVFRALEGGKGIFNFSAGPDGTNSDGSVLDLGDKTAEGLVVIIGAKLALTEVIMPKELNIGQGGGEVKITATNLGESSAILNGLNLYVFDQKGKVLSKQPIVFTAGASNPKSIEGGATEQFGGIINVLATANAGSYLVGSQLSGLDERSSATVSNEIGDSLANFKILRPARLVVSSVEVPLATLSQGMENFTIEVTVSNDGEAPAKLDNVSLIFQDESQATATNKFVYLARSSGTIVGGESQKVVVDASVSDSTPSGSYEVFASISASDLNDGSQTRDDSTESKLSDTFIVIRPAEVDILSATTSASRASQGQTGITVQFVAKNIGSEDIGGISGGLRFFKGTTEISGEYVVTVNNANKTLLAPNEQATYQFSFAVSDEASAGITLVNPVIDAIGVISQKQTSDELAGQLNLQILKKATLSTEILFAKNPITEGQQIGVQLHVTNSGEATALNVVIDPIQLVPTGSGKATYVSGPVPVSFSIPGGTSKDFVYSYNTTGGASGSLVFSGTAKGSDELSQREVASSQGKGTIAIQTPAKVDILSVTASQALVSRGQNALVMMNVRNSGTATLMLDPAITGLKFADSSQNDLSKEYTVTITSPADDLVLPGTSERILNFQVVVASGATIDTEIAIDGYAGGKDINNDAATLDNSANAKGKWTVKTPAKFSVDTILISPATVNQGQANIPISMNVSNSGGASAAIVSHTLILRDANNSDVSGQYSITPSPNNQDTVSGGGVATLSYTMGVSSSASTGVITVDGTIGGKDLLSNKDISKTGATTTDTIVVQIPAKLVSTLNASPVSISEGQTITLNHLVENQGGSTANLVVPTAPAITGTGKTVLATGPVPLNATIGGGGSQVFTYTYTTTGGDNGDLTFSAKAGGKDNNTAATIQSEQIDSNRVTIKSPAQFKVLSVKSPKAKLSQGQSGVALTVSVKNSGGAPAIVQNGSLDFKDGSGNSLAGDYSLVAGQNPTTIQGGETLDFSYTLSVRSVAQTGAVTVDFTIQGVDANSFVPIDDDGADIPLVYTVQTPANLTIQNVIATATKVSRGQAGVALQVNLLNNGQADATLGPATLSFVKDGNSVDQNYTVLASSSNPTSLPGGQSKSLNFTLSLTQNAELGTIIIDASANASDVNSGSAISASSALADDSWLVQTPSAFSIQSVSSSFASVVRQQSGIDINVVVSNTGGADAQVSSISPKILDAGQNNHLSEYTITPSASNPTSINGSTSATFAYTLIASATASLGAMTLDASISGSDKNSATTKSDDGADTTDSWTVIKPAILTGTIAVSPNKISEGQTVTMTFSVANSGDVAALAVAPALPTLNGQATKVSGPVPASSNISPGQTVQFGYTYSTTTGDAGTLDFTTSASGTDSVLNVAVNSAAVTSAPVAVQTPATLSILSLGTVPDTITKVTQGQQTINFKVQVQNTGSATGNVGNVVLDFIDSSLIDVSGQYTVVKVGHPATIAGGATVDFNFSVGVSATATIGTITVDGTATGTDANSGLAIGDNDATIKETIQVETPPLVEILSLSTTPTEISQGQQNIAVSMVVSNSGGATAKVTSASLKFTGSSDRANDYNVTASPQNPTQLLGGQQLTFNFSVSVKVTAEAGAITIDGSFTGTDANDSTRIVRDDNGAASSDSWTVVQPAAFAVQTVTASKPAVVRTETGLSVSATVKNTGGAKAMVGSADLKLTQSGNDLTAEYTIAADGANPLEIPPGQTKSFSFTVAVKSGATLGSTTIQATLSGTDANSGFAITDDTALTPAVWNVKSLATLVSALSLSDSKISEGEAISVTMTVNNDGQTDALNVSPSALVLGGTGQASLSTAPSNGNVTIVAGGSATFVYAYATDDNSSGTLTFTGNAAGVNAVVASAVSSSATTSSAVDIQNPAQLSITSVTTASTRVSQGQSGISVSVTIANPGQAKAGVASSALKFTGSVDRTSEYTVVSGTNPATIDGGSQAVFAYTVQAKSDAVIGEAITIDASVSGSDANSANPLSDTGATTTDQWIVDTPATLEVVSIDFVAASVSQGQNGVALVLDVRNTGSAAASISSVQWNFLTSAGLTVSAEYVTTANPANPTTVGGNTTTTLNYTVTVGDTASTGTIKVKANVGGKDANSNTTIGDSSLVVFDQFIVETPAVLDITTVAIAPSTLNKASKGQTNIIVNVTIRNTGGVQASNVSPSLVFYDSNLTLKTADFTVVAIPIIPSTIGVGQTKIFNFEFSVKSTASSGLRTVDAQTSGTDVNSLKIISDAAATTPDSLTIETPANLTITQVQESYTTVSKGQTGLSVSFSVQNSGEATGSISSSDLVFKDPIGTEISTTQFTITPVSEPGEIAGGATSVFTYTVDVKSAALAQTITIDATVSGADVNTGSPVSDTSATTKGGFTVQEPAALDIASVSTTPLKVSRGQQNVLVSMNVGNPGGASATIASVSLSFTDSIALVRTSEYSISPVDGNATSIDGNASTVLNYLVSISGSATLGVITLNGSVSGKDQNSNSTISDPASASTDTWTVQTAASLTIVSVVTATDTAVRNQAGIRVDLTGRNDGWADASISAANLTFTRDNGDVNSEFSVVADPTNPASILGGAVRVFSFTVTVGANAGQGSVVIDGALTATDSNSAKNVSKSGASTSDAILIKTPALLSITSLSADKTKASRGQSGIAVAMVVANQGSSVAVMTAADPVFKKTTVVTADYVITPALSNPTTIAGLASATFQYTVDVKSTATTGQITVDGSVAATDELSGAVTSDSTATTTGSILVQTPAVLDILSVATTPSTVSQGQQNVAVSVSIKNTGEADATVESTDLIFKDPLSNDLSTQYNSVASGVPPTSIAGAATAIFTFEVDIDVGATVGQITIDAKTDGLDGNKGTALSDPTATTKDQFVVQTPAALEVLSVSSTTSLVSPGQTGISVVVSIRNNGEATGSLSALSLNFLNSSAQVRNAYYSPTIQGALGTITAGNTEQYTYLVDTLSTTPKEIINIFSQVTASDTNTGQNITVSGASAKKHQMTVQQPATLVISQIDFPSLVLPYQVSQGQSGITVTYNVANTGQAAVTITATGLGFTHSTDGNKNGDYLVVANVANPTSIVGGAVATMTFAVQVKNSASGGIVSVDGTITGKDANSQAVVSDTGADTTRSWTVKTPANFLISTIGVNKSKASQGQTGLVVTMNVENNGTSIGLVGSSGLSFANGGNVSAQYTVTAAPSNPVQIAGSGSGAFVFTVNASGSATVGSVTVDGSISGTDELSGAATSDSTAATPASLTIQTPALLDILSVATTPTTVSRGQSGIAVIVSVRNNGQADATIDFPQLSFSDIGATDRTSEYTQTPGTNPGTILGGATQSLSISVGIGSAATIGDINLDAKISGVDLNSAATIGDLSATTKDQFAVQLPAALSVSSLSSPTTTASKGQTGITVVVTLANTGLATATMSSLSLNFLNDGGTSRNTLYSQQLQTTLGTIAGGQSKQYSFSVGVGSSAIAENINIRATLAAVDANSGTSVLVSGTTTQHSILVKEPAALAVSTISFPALTLPYKVSQGQTGVSVSATIANSGQVAATISSSLLHFSLSGQNKDNDYILTVSGANPTTIAPSSSETFNYTVDLKSSATGGNVVVDAEVSGTDSLSGLAISDNGAATTRSWLVETPADLAITSVSTVPTKISRGQTAIGVVVVVANTGTASATGVVANLVMKTAGGAPVTSNYTITSAPANPATIAGSGSATYNFSVDAATGAVIGPISVFGTVNGIDSNTGGALSDAPTSIKDTWTVQTPAALAVIGVSVDPVSVSQGQEDFLVTVELDNSGEAAATVGSVSLAFALGGTSKTTQYTVTPDPANPTSIEGLSSGTFSFAVDASLSASTGTITANASVLGSDANSGQSLSDPGADSTDTFLLQSPANLSIVSVSAVPTEVSRNQSAILVTMRVANTGQAGISISSSGLRFFDGDLIERTSQDYQSATVTAPTSIAGGDTADYQYNVTVNSTARAGLITVNGTVSGTDQNSGSTKSDSTATTPHSWTVKTGAVLSIGSVSTLPTKVSRGQTGIVVTMNVQNTGDVSANVGSATVKLKDGEGTPRSVEYGIEAAPANPTSIDPGGNALFSFTLSAGGAATTGTITLDGSISGSDANSGTTISDTSATTTDQFTVQTPALLSITSTTTTPQKVSRGQTGVTVTTLVANTGQADATSLSTSPVFFVETTPVYGSFTVTPSGANPSSIVGGGTGTYTYSVDVASGAVLGLVTLDANVSGRDANTLAALSDQSGSQDSFTVQTKASLSIVSLSTAALAVNRGQGGITVTMVISNGGQATADIASAVPVFKDGSNNDVSGQYTVTPGANPSQISGGTSGTFSYSVEVHGDAALGAISIDGAVTGSDGNSTAALVDNGADATDGWTVQLPAQLTIGTVATTPTFVSQGQTGIAITMGVTNNGGAQVNITSAVLSFANSGGQSQTYSVTANPGNPTFIGGSGSSGTFSFQVDLPVDALTGPITIDGSIGGTDSNSGGLLNDNGATTVATFTVQTKAAFTIVSVVTTPDKVSQSQSGIAFTVQARNDGQATLNIASLGLKFGIASPGDVDSDYVVTITPGNPASLTSGQTGTFLYTVALQGNATTGAVSIYGNPAGTDNNSGSAAALSGLSVKDQFLVQTPASLSVASSIEFDPASGATTDNVILIKISVSNNGQAIADDVDPADTLSLVGSATLTLLGGGPTPGTPSDLLNGGTRTYTYSYTAGSAGTITNVNGFSVAGTDGNSGQAVSANRNFTIAPNYSIAVGSGRNEERDLAIVASYSPLKEVAQYQTDIPVSLVLINNTEEEMVLYEYAVSLTGRTGGYSSKKSQEQVSVRPRSTKVVGVFLDLALVVPGTVSLMGVVEYGRKGLAERIVNRATATPDYLAILAKADIRVLKVSYAENVVTPGQQGIHTQLFLQNIGDSPAILTGLDIHKKTLSGEVNDWYIDLLPLDPTEVYIDGGSGAWLNYLLDLDPMVYPGETILNVKLSYQDNLSGRNFDRIDIVDEPLTVREQFERYGEGLPAGGASKLAMIDDVLVVIHDTAVSLYRAERAQLRLNGSFALETRIFDIGVGDLDGDGRQEGVLLTGRGIFTLKQQEDSFAIASLNLELSIDEGRVFVLDLIDDPVAEIYISTGSSQYLFVQGETSPRDPGLYGLSNLNSITAGKEKGRYIGITGTGSLVLLERKPSQFVSTAVIEGALEKVIEFQADEGGDRYLLNYDRNRGVVYQWIDGNLEEVGLFGDVLQSGQVYRSFVLGGNGYSDLIRQSETGLDGLFNLGGIFGLRNLIRADLSDFLPWDLDGDGMSDLIIVDDDKIDTYHNTIVH